MSHQGFLRLPGPKSCPNTPNQLNGKAGFAPANFVLWGRGSLKFRGWFHWGEVLLAEQANSEGMGSCLGGNINPLSLWLETDDGAARLVEVAVQVRHCSMKFAGKVRILKTTSRCHTVCTDTAVFLKNFSLLLSSESMNSLWIFISFPQQFLTVC